MYTRARYAKSVQANELCWHKYMTIIIELRCVELDRDRFFKVMRVFNSLTGRQMPDMFIDRMRLPPDTRLLTNKHVTELLRDRRCANYH